MPLALLGVGPGTSGGRGRRSAGPPTVSLLQGCARGALWAMGDCMVHAGPTLPSCQPRQTVRNAEDSLGLYRGEVGMELPA